MEEALPKNPNLELAQWRFLLTCATEDTKKQVRAKLLQAIETDKMLPLYLGICDQFKWEQDGVMVEKMSSDNASELKALEDKIKDAEENLGESEIREALLAKSDFLCRIGEKDKAVAAYRLTYDKTIALGQKLDVIFSIIRIGIFHKDDDLITRNIEKAKSLIEEGGDWDRRNRLKTYEALHLLWSRDFKKAADLLLEVLATFTSFELFEFRSFIYYLVLVCVFSLDRVRLKTKVIESPDVLAVIHEIPHLASFLSSLYNSDYAQFFVDLAAITDSMKLDRYFAPHAAFYCREMRIAAYAQMLESYSSVKLGSMAQAYGVTEEFIDRELSRFIAAGRLHCKVDKVGGIVETNRPDAKNSLYQQTIKQGDLLLNRIQKLSRIINL